MPGCNMHPMAPDVQQQQQHPAQELPSGGMQITIAPQPNGEPGVPGPDRIVTGHVAVPEAALRGADRVEIQYRGVEVVGGTLDDYETDRAGGLAARKGVRALSRVYFDERLVLWQRGAGAGAGAAGAVAVEPALLPFSIAYPNANYPCQARSESRAAPSQAFEIAYHIVAWLVGADNAPVARFVAAVPFVPAYSSSNSSGSGGSDKPPPAAVAQTGYDDRGKECLLTRVTLSQAEYMPGDQVVAGVYIEATRANRTIRRAECTLRQRVECRMRRTFTPAETAAAAAELASPSRPPSRPPSSQPPPPPLSSASDDSDVLWSRVTDIGPPQALTLTSSGVGLAAAAAAVDPPPTTTTTAAAAPHHHHHHPGSSPSSSQRSSVPGADAAAAASSAVADRRDSAPAPPRAAGSTRTPSIMAGFRTCTANMHTSIPANAAVIPGHFLIFSYELQIDVTIGSIGRGTQRISTRTQLGTAGPPRTQSGGATPTSVSGLTFPRLSARNRALAEAHATGACLSAAAAAAPPPSQQKTTATAAPSSGLLLDARETADLRRARLSYAGPAAENNDADAESVYRLSALRPAPMHRGLSTATTTGSGASQGVADDGDGDGDGDDGRQLPNAVELLRYRCAASQALMPKIFDPTRPASAAHHGAPAVSASGGGDGARPAAGIAAMTPAESAGASPESLAAPADDTAGAGRVFIGTAAAATVLQPVADGSGEPGDGDGSGSGGGSSGGMDFDLAGAVLAAAEKVINDKEWERPDSRCFLPPRAKKGTRQGRARSGGSGNNSSSASSATDSNSGSDSQPMFDAEDGSGEGGNGGERDQRQRRRRRRRHRHRHRHRRGSAGSSGSESSRWTDIDRDGILDAISRLAPPKRPAELQTDAAMLGDMMQGMEFFDSRDDAGPELTGLLSADPDKLTFGNPLVAALEPPSLRHAEPGPEEGGPEEGGPEKEAAAAAAAAAVAAAVGEPAEPPRPADEAKQQQDTAATKPEPPAKHQDAAAAAAKPAGKSRMSTRFGWMMLTPPAPAPQQISTVLRRSISMPGATSSAENLGGPELAQKTPSPQDHEGEEENGDGPTVARSAHEPGEYHRSILLRRSRTTGRVSGVVAPGPMLTAMSSSSRMGAATRANMLRNIGQRVSSWFTKK